MKIYSVAFFRHDASAYEHPNAGESQGKFFVNFLRVMVRAFHACWAGGGWQLWIHHDDRVKEMRYFRALVKMEDAGLLKLIDMGKAETLCGSMLWRLAPVSEPDVDVVVCRDIDSLPMPHERRAVDEWLKTGKDVHVMHGSESHSGIMGGTLAVRASGFGKKSAHFDNSWMTWLAAQQHRLKAHGSDQHLLNEMRGQYENSMLIHKLKNARMNGEGQAEVRTIVSEPTPMDICLPVATHGDSFANFVGACYDVEPPYAFYNSLESFELEWLSKIIECERAVR